MRALIVCFAVCAAAHGATLSSVWAPSPIRPDGDARAEEWQAAEVALRLPQGWLSAVNDAEALYLRLDLPERPARSGREAIALRCNDATFGFGRQAPDARTSAAFGAGGEIYRVWEMRIPLAEAAARAGGELTCRLEVEAAGARSWSEEATLALASPPRAAVLAVRPERVAIAEARPVRPTRPIRVRTAQLKLPKVQAIGQRVSVLTPAGATLDLKQAPTPPCVGEGHLRMQVLPVLFPALPQSPGEGLDQFWLRSHDQALRRLIEKLDVWEQYASLEEEEFGAATEEEEEDLFERVGLRQDFVVSLVCGEDGCLAPLTDAEDQP